jgi:hypothetical protein
MVPAHAAPPMSGHPIGAGQTPRYPDPVSPATTPGGAPSGGPGPGPVPSTDGGFTLPALDPSIPPPPDPVSALAGGLLSGGPPPPLQVGGLGLNLR